MGNVLPMPRNYHKRTAEEFEENSSVTPSAVPETPRTPRYSDSSTGRSKRRGGRRKSSRNDGASSGRAAAAGSASGAAASSSRAADKSAASQGRKAKRQQRRHAARTEKTHEPGIVARVVNSWWNRLLGAIYSGNFADQSEQYLAHQTTRDYICNTCGEAANGALFPILTMICSQLLGAVQAGQFSMAFTIGSLLLFVANYGARTYQVSDLDEMQSFLDYQVNRLLTCAAALAVGMAWFKVMGYEGTMLSICSSMLVYRAVDGLADVYEGRLHQKDKLYLGGLAQAIRCVVAGVAFAVVLLLTGSLSLAGWALAIGGVASLLVVTIPLAYFETDKSLPLTLRGVRELFVQCFPLFIALFLYNLIDSMPKFAMEQMLSYDNQLYYNAMYFPAHCIMMFASFIYKPQLVRLARIWEDPEKHKRFDLIVVAMFAVIAVITAILAAFMGWIGIPLLSLMYGVDFEQFRSLVYVMIVMGGLAACIDFLYQIITVLRAQGSVMRLFLIAVVFSVPICYLLVGFADLAGAVLSGVVVMAILMVLLITEYARIHKQAAQAY